MVRVGIPIFQNRVSPVLDSCTRLLVVHVANGREVERQEYFLDHFSFTERFQVIQRAALNVLICCGISDVLFNMLNATDAKLICGIVGNVDEVLSAFLSDRLDDPSFRMPGYVRNE